MFAPPPTERPTPWPPRRVGSARTAGPAGPPPAPSSPTTRAASSTGRGSSTGARGGRTRTLSSSTATLHIITPELLGAVGGTLMQLEMSPVVDLNTPELHDILADSLRTEQREMSAPRAHRAAPLAAELPRESWSSRCSCEGTEYSAQTRADTPSWPTRDGRPQEQPPMARGDDRRLLDALRDGRRRARAGRASLDAHAFAPRALEPRPRPHPSAPQRPADSTHARPPLPDHHAHTRSAPRTCAPRHPPTPAHALLLCARLTPHTRPGASVTMVRHARARDSDVEGCQGNGGRQPRSVSPCFSFALAPDLSRAPAQVEARARHPHVWTGHDGTPAAPARGKHLEATHLHLAPYPLASWCQAVGGAAIGPPDQLTS